MLLKQIIHPFSALLTQRAEAHSQHGELISDMEVLFLITASSQSNSQQSQKHHICKWQAQDPETNKPSTLYPITEPRNGTNRNGSGQAPPRTSLLVKVTFTEMLKEETTKESLTVCE